MGFKTLISYPFVDWIRPISFMFLSLPLFLIGIVVDNGLFNLIAGTIFFISVLILLISMFLLLFKKRWRESFYTFLFIITTIITIGLMMSS